MDEPKGKGLTKFELRAACTHFLSGHHPQTQRAWLESLAASPLTANRLDIYGEGPAIQALETEVAQLLGKEAAVFLHKGVIAQQIALRVWADRRGHRNIALHPKSHIDADENSAYERLHNLAGVRVGKDHSPFTLAELQAVHQPLGAVTIELPLRRAGYKLPSWEELVEMAEWTHTQKIPLHFDGARLWEAGPFYKRSYAEIAALADSVYVSFYKGLGGLAGCILAGPLDFIAEAKVWKTRLGGDLFTMFPYVIAASEGLQHHLPKMERYCELAQQIAEALADLPGVAISPNPPQTNAFQIYLARSLAALQKANLRIAYREQIWLFNFLEETALPGLTMGEITVGEATEDWTIEAIVEAVHKLLTSGKR